MTVGPTSETPDLGRRERRKLEVRNRILEAGSQLFESQGIDATRVQEVCALADVAHKTFFNHFPSKRHLLREIAQAGVDQLLLDIEEVRKAPVSSRERIRLFFERIADNADAAGPMRRELLTEMVHVSHESGAESEQARQLHDAFGALVREGLGAGDLTTRHAPDTLTDMLMGAFYVLMFNWANLDDYPMREHALAMTSFLADSMSPDESECSA
ncbi:MAG: TetR/AcrR family transcriptional regulator [Deltaproteobacteria bacterium]|nr:TetR/AcrR family transcriptional regulator [Deltaproteobacteria bacterium]MBW2697925.1 TetR/AcrR family transcriptional regulator [Deltaproteobacteria bacterium]